MKYLERVAKNAPMAFYINFSNMDLENDSSRKS